MASFKAAANKLGSRIAGDIDVRKKTLAKYRHDASLFELTPQVVVYPRSAADIEETIRFVREQRLHHSGLSITARSGGTDMSGGAISDSLILDLTRYMNSVGRVMNGRVTTEPGAYYRDFEPVTLAAGQLLPSFPASRELCTIGGMVANNSGGEKSLIYGKTERYVTRLQAVLRDGHAHTLEPLSGAALAAMLKRDDIEGRLHKRVHELLREHRKAILASRPKVTKNSTGYNIWDAWDGKTLDLTKLFVGSQGTLGIITEAELKLVPVKPFGGMVVAFLPNLDRLGQVINALLPLKPTALESFDEHTLKFALRFFLSFRKTLGWGRFVLLGVSFLPLLNKLLRFLPRLPKLIVLVHFEADSQAEIDKRIAKTKHVLEPLGIETDVAEDKKHEEKFWIMRRESFNLLRKNVKRKHTAPFIDDLVVPPAVLPEFLPRLQRILEKHELLYTVAGHIGDGNFHIIPLMDLSDSSERAKIPVVLEEVLKLVLAYGGSLSGEHNDGMIRGPFLKQMYGDEIYGVMREIKHVFDPENMFNPHKKTDATWEFAEVHIRRRF